MAAKLITACLACEVKSDEITLWLKKGSQVDSTPIKSTNVAELARHIEKVSKALVFIPGRYGCLKANELIAFLSTLKSKLVICPAAANETGKMVGPLFNAPAFSRSYANATADLYDFLSHPFTKNPAELTDLVKSHPGGSAALRLIKDGGDCLSAYMVLRILNDMRPILAYLYTTPGKDSGVSPKNIVNTLMAFGGPGMLNNAPAHLIQAIRDWRAGGGDKENMLPADFLVRAVYGLQPPQGDDYSWHRFEQAILSKNELDTGLAFGAALSLHSIISKWISSEYHPDLCDNAYDKYYATKKPK